MLPETLISALKQVATRQFGLVSKVQALELGVKERYLQETPRGAGLVRVCVNVYRLEGFPTPWPHALKAASLWAGERAVLSHRSALALWGLADFFKSHVELTSTSVLTPPAGFVFHRTRQLHRADWTVKRGMAVTTPERTLLDLAGLISKRTIEKAVDRGMHDGVLDAQQLVWCIARNKSRGRVGVAQLRDVAHDRLENGGTDSDLETDVLIFLRERGLPKAARQFEVEGPLGWIARVDFAWPEKKVALLSHGGNVHRQFTNWQVDQMVENRLTDAGWTFYKVTKLSLRESAQELEDQLRRKLGL